MVQIKYTFEYDHCPSQFIDGTNDCLPKVSNITHVQLHVSLLRI